MKALKNANVYIEGKGFLQTDLLFDKTFVSFSIMDNVEILNIPQNCFVVPGFIDEHVHGALGKTLLLCDDEGLQELCNAYAKEGVTSFLPTFEAQDKSILLKGLSNTAKYIHKKNDVGAEILGIHMEGPFLSPNCKGAMKAENMLSPSIKQFEEFYQASEGNIRLITIAPDVDGSYELIQYCKNLGVIVSIGHTMATYEQVSKAVEYGAGCVTHTYNAQRGLHHREVGTLGAALLLDDLTCEIISDCIHVSVPAIQLLLKNKSKDKIVMISDATAGHGLPEGKITVLGEEQIIKDGMVCKLDGTLTGSVMSINKMLSCMVEKVGVDLQTAVDFVTINPAKNLGIDKTKGSIALGKDADFTVIDPNFDIYMTVRAGKVIYRKQV